MKKDTKEEGGGEDSIEREITGNEKGGGWLSRWYKRDRERERESNRGWNGNVKVF